MMTREEFEDQIRAAFFLLPEKFREKIKNVAFLVETEPSDEVRKREGLAEGETLLGYYQGIPQTVRGGEYGVGPTLPDTITLYQLPIEEEARGEIGRVSQIVADTIWHEVAHYFGYEEGEVREREDGRSFY